MNEPTSRRSTPRAPGARPTPNRGRVQPRTGQQRRPSTAVYRRRRLVVLGGGFAVVIVLGLVGAFGWPGFARSADSATATATATVTLAPPSPTISPIERTASTAFARALPSTVLDFALVAEEASPALIDAGALEGYTFTYANGTGADATTVTVDASQWATQEDAEAAATAITSSLGTPTDSGEVISSGATAGTYVIVDNGDGTATAVWTDVTALFQATGPVTAVRDLYAAFPI